MSKQEKIYAASSFKMIYTKTFETIGDVEKNFRQKLINELKEYSAV